MSRCFPFPPPGYEKKAKTDDVDSLIKDKHKEKKHKKEKKDKKKEGKDKDKERSKDKDREKERKEKHKDKDKDKDKDKKRSKDKRRTDENKTEGPLDGSSGSKQNEFNQQAETFKDTKFLGIDQRIANEERGRKNQMVENLPASDPGKDDAVTMLVDKYYDNWVQEKEKVDVKDGHDKKGERQSIKHDGRVVGNSPGSSFSGAEQKRIGSTVRPMAKGAQSSLVSSFSGAEQYRNGNTVRSMEKSAENALSSSFSGAEQKRTGNTVKSMEKGAENSLASSFSGAEQKRTGSNVKPTEKAAEDIFVSSFNSVKPMEKDAQNSPVSLFSGADQKRTGSIVKPVEKDPHKKDRKEKNKEHGGNEKRKEKHKHRDGDKKSKEKKAEKEKAKEKVKHEDRKDRTVEVPKDHINTLNIRPIQIPQDNEKSHSMEDNPRKRKDCETNGFLHDNVLSNKLPKPTLSSHPLIANGKKSEPGQPISPFATPMPRGSNNIMWDKKVLIANGLLPSVSSTSLSTPRVKSKENGESSQKPTHPDAKYLSKILTVPKMNDLPDFDDQEWLFSSDSQGKKPKTVTSGVDGSPQVWDRALRIDSADICALPYVIPY